MTVWTSLTDTLWALVTSTCATGIDLSQTEFFRFFGFSVSGLELDESQLRGENSKFCDSRSYKGGKKGPVEDHTLGKLHVT